MLIRDRIFNKLEELKMTQKGAGCDTGMAVVRNRSAGKAQ